MVRGLPSATTTGGGGGGVLGGLGRLMLWFTCALLTWELGGAVPTEGRVVFEEVVVVEGGERSRSGALVEVVEEVRLVDGSVPHLGNVQVRVGGQWGFVCDDDFGFEAADLVCRELGYPRAERYTRAHRIGLHSEPWTRRKTIFLGKTNCTSNNNNNNNNNNTLDALTLDDNNNNNNTLDALTLDDNNNNNNSVNEVGYSRLSDCFVYGDPECADREVAGVECVTEEAPPPCLPDQFQCSGLVGVQSNSSTWDGVQQCIPRSSVCDSEFDCYGGLAYDENVLNCQDDLQVAKLSPPDLDNLPRGVTPESSPVTSLVQVPGALVGNLLLKREGVWGTVCDQEFHVGNVKTLCRMMGHGDGWWVRAVLGAGLGRGTGVIHRDLMDCRGDEGFLSQCFALNAKTSSSCSHSRDVGVFCYGQGVEVRLGGEGVELREDEVGGRVEVRVGGEWMAACDTGFDDYDAKVVCRQLGYRTGGESRAYRGSLWGSSPRNLPLLRLALDCHGSEDDLQECMVIPLTPANHTCTRDTLASVVCSNRTGDLDEDIRELFPLDCGKPMDASTQFLTSLAKIRFGSRPSMFDKPWAATLRSRSLFGSYYSLSCGATILNEDFLLTSASCFDPLRGKEDFLVRVGDYNINFNDTQQDDFYLDKVIQHEHFQELGPRDNDIALVKIKRKHGRGMRLGERVMAACLPPDTTADNYPSGLPCTVTGWGASDTSTQASTMPQTARIKLTDEKACRRTKGMQGGVEEMEEQTSSLLCDGGILSLDDGPCLGDFGAGLTCTANNDNDSPATAPHGSFGSVGSSGSVGVGSVSSVGSVGVDSVGGGVVYLRHFVYGVATSVSFADCRVREQRDVYTDVRKFRRWIVDVVTKYQ